MRGIRWLLVMSAVPILAGCGLPVVRTQSSVEVGQAKLLLCYVDRTGNTLGVDHLSVDEDGGVNVFDAVGNKERSPRGMTATPEQFDALQQAVTSAEWQALDEEYGQPATDAITYDIHCGGTQLMVHPGAERPAIVNDVIQQLETLWEQAEPIN